MVIKYFTTIAHAGTHPALLLLGHTLNRETTFANKVPIIMSKPSYNETKLYTSEAIPDRYKERIVSLTSIGYSSGNAQRLAKGVQR